MFGFITNSKPFKKYKYKSELSLIKKKLDFLTEEALSNNATKADILFWDTLLERLDEINNENIINECDDVYKYYLNIYDKYVKIKKDK